jgi:glycosyltransferase involved in cell wall biosynthesis
MIAEGAHPERITVCHTGGATRGDEDLGAARARCRQELGVDAHARLLVYPARLCAQKQPRVFAETMRVLADQRIPFTCVVAGDGPDRAWLGAYVKRHRLTGRVRLVGAVSPARMSALMAAADICFLPSTHEGVALTLYEAMSAGAVFVGADVGGQREVLSGECGVLLPRLGDELREAGAYAVALSRLLRDPIARQAMGSAARRRIAEGFSIARMADEIEAALAQARRLHLEAPPVSIDHAVGNLTASRAIEYQRMADLAELRWAHPPDVLAGGGWRLWIFRQFTWLEPAYAWGLRRGWHWLPAARERIRAALAS